MPIDIGIAKAGYVEDNRIDEVKEALVTMSQHIDRRDQFTFEKRKNYNFNDHVVANSKSETKRNVEEKLYNDGELDDKNIWILVHDNGGVNSEGMKVAGVAFFTNAGQPNSNRKYESEAGYYGISFVNATTRHAPYNLDTSRILLFMR